MGTTLPSYRMAVEWEKRKWKTLWDSLDKSERKIFDIFFQSHKVICLFAKIILQLRYL